MTYETYSVLLSSCHGLIYLNEAKNIHADFFCNFQISHKCKVIMSFKHHHLHNNDLEEECFKACNLLVCVLFALNTRFLFKINEMSKSKLL